MTPEDADLVRRFRDGDWRYVLGEIDIRAAAEAIERLSAENDDNIERWKLYQSLCDEIMAEKEAAEAEADQLADYLRERSGSQITRSKLLAAHAARRGGNDNG